MPWYQSFWNNSFSSNTDWIELAFTKAHEIDPLAVLLLNDAGIEFYGGDPLYGRDRTDKIFNLAKSLKEREVPIDGIGFQMHLYGEDFMTQSQIEARTNALAINILRYREAGFEVYVTEWDIRMNNVPRSESEEVRIQANAYKAIMQVLVRTGVKSISFFGVKDSQSWLENPDINGPDAKDSNPLLFDDNGQPKMSYYAILSVLYWKANDG